MWKCGKVNQKTRANENERQTFDAGKEVVITYTDEVYNYLLIITYCLHFPICICHTFTPVASLPFPTDGYINNRGQNKNLHFPDAFLAK